MGPGQPTRSEGETPPPHASAEAARWIARLNPGDKVGPYTLRELLGEGGMGVVWLAERTEPVSRKVALKILKTAPGASSARARFELERTILARLEHPHIAKVFDAGDYQPVPGTDPIPFYAMELVRGEPITAYFARRPHDLPTLLSTFACVCDAVQYAHDRGVIHRDIKPSNILVSEVDAKPFPS